MITGRFVSLNIFFFQHPGIASVCHRGCEIFTVALITTPIGGIPRIGITQDKSIRPKINTANASILLMKNDPDFKKTDLDVDTPFESHKRDKVMRQKHEMENTIAHRMESIGKSKSVKDSERMRSIMKTVNEQKQQLKERIRKYHRQNAESKKKDADRETTSKASVEKNVGDITKSLRKHDGIFGKELKEMEKVSKNIAKKNDDKSMVKMPVEQEKSEFHIHQVLHSNEATKVIKNLQITTKKPIPTLTNDEGRELWKTVRNIDNVVKQSVAHGPVPISKNKKSKGNAKLDGNVPKSRDDHSKTTVQPLPHPVQDHPVHANRQITTDSSDADERKTTTPQTSNPVAPVNQRIQEFDAFSRLANKLGTIDNHAHPFLHLNFLKVKPDFGMMFPQQISIIEIVKKKNNIDFEKLHQDHMKEAARCPRIHDRFEQAKQSCRHGKF